MGQKTHPTGFRLGIIRTWNSRWFGGKQYADWLNEDISIRRFIERRLARAGIAGVDIERQKGKVIVNINTARPGMVIGRKGAEVDLLRDQLKHLTGKDVKLNIKEVKKPEMDARLVAEHIANQLVNRINFKRAMKKSLTSAIRMGAKGIKIQCSGRLNGAEIARTEHYHEGEVPLHTLRANIDYNTATAVTTFGTVGVKVWINHGEIFPKEFRKLQGKQVQEAL
ncbi:MAG: 30S ribosomal protein S3 [Candidatus Krumholzibacteria bacterium]|nr:30S ribosomal protein S3 [Candidatus Krumholzibacteria bacterium]MDP6797825.1 30S ribosomal protein S3 [Candidatus Krumholzibacteria bacterium]MDP7022068.1 30S ribosomal protein S3 [Candidatus Krumholzibacteria bacterium]